VRTDLCEHRSTRLGLECRHDLHHRPFPELHRDRCLAVCVWGGLYIRANKLAWKQLQKHPGLWIPNKFGIRRPPFRHQAGKASAPGQKGHVGRLCPVSSGVSASQTAAEPAPRRAMLGNRNVPWTATVGAYFRRPAVCPSRESRLTPTRTCLSWLSANDWAYGSIYGTVQFTFDWIDLVQDRAIFWVEEIDSYKPAVYRFLLAREVDSRKLPDGVVPYDPRKSGGPLLLEGDEWFWNGSYTSEFMIDSDVQLSRCRSIKTVSHHPQFCSLRTSCREIGWGASKAGTLLIARLLGHGIGSMFVRKALLDEGRLGFTAEDGLGWFLMKCGVYDMRPGPNYKADEESLRALVQGALALYGNERPDEAKALLALIGSAEPIRKVLDDIVHSNFGVHLRPDD